MKIGVKSWKIHDRRELRDSIAKNRFAGEKQLVSNAKRAWKIPWINMTMLGTDCFSSFVVVLASLSRELLSGSVFDFGDEVLSKVLPLTGLEFFISDNMGLSMVRKTRIVKVFAREKIFVSLLRKIHFLSPNGDWTSI